MAKLVSVLALPVAFLASTAFAQSRPSAAVTVTIDQGSRGNAIPADFSGLSFERGTLNSNNAGVSGYLFSPSNTQLLTLFQNIGIHNLRVGGGSVDTAVPAGYNPDGYTGIDNLFDFAQAAGAKVIYTVRMLNTKNTLPNLKAQNAAIAGHIWQRNRLQLDNFAIGNEPDWHNPYHTSGDPALFETTSGVPGSAYPSYLADWQAFTGTILEAVPAATFSGPDTGAYTTQTYTPDPATGVSWTQQFADDEKNAVNGSGSPLLVQATQHHYVGGSPGSTTAQQAIDNMLSRNWIMDTEISKGPEGSETYTPYPWLFTHNIEPLLKNGATYRMTEANDVLTGINGASNGYAAALWALDYMHWWAAHGMSGVDFHNKQWIISDTIVPSPNPCQGTCGNYQTTPKGYGIKAFELGSHGYVEPVTISNPNEINLTAYAVGEGRDLYVTIINKTHQSTNDSTDAVVTIRPSDFAAASATSMVLTSGDPGNASLMTAMLGGASITNNARWLGKWVPLSPETSGSVMVTVPSATATVVRIRAAGNYAGPIQINQNGTLEIFGTSPNYDSQHHDGNESDNSHHGPQARNIWHDLQILPDVASGGSNQWDGWANLGGEINSNGGMAVIKNLDNTLEIFVPSTTGDVYYNHQSTPNGSWNGWTDMGSSSNGVTGLQASNNADGSLSVFGVGVNGDVWYASQNAPGVAWSDWTDLSGEQIQSGFVVGQNLDGRLEVFGVDDGGNVWHNCQADAGSWSGWTELSSPLLNPHLAIARNLDGRLEVFGVDRNNYVWHNWQISLTGDWNGWLKIPGKQLEPGLVVGQNMDGRLVVFGVSSHGHDDWNRGDDSHSNRGGGEVWSIEQRTAGESFDQWAKLGGINIDPKLVVGNKMDGRIQLFGIGSNRRVWSNLQSTDGQNWGGWTDLGGKGIQF